jgi:hypothetical protein
MSNDTLTANPLPSVTPPPGASFVDDWQSQQYRIVLGPRRDIGGRVEVWSSAAQLADGTIDASSQVEPPLVHMQVSDYGLTVRQARDLARAIIEATNDLDGWTR